MKSMQPPLVVIITTNICDRREDNVFSHVCPSVRRGSLLETYPLSKWDSSPAHSIKGGALLPPHNPPKEGTDQKEGPLPLVGGIGIWVHTQGRPTVLSGDWRLGRVEWGGVTLSCLGAREEYRLCRPGEG